MGTPKYGKLSSSKYGISDDDMFEKSPSPLKPKKRYTYTEEVEISDADLTAQLAKPDKDINDNYELLGRVPEVVKDAAAIADEEARMNEGKKIKCYITVSYLFLCYFLLGEIEEINRTIKKFPADHPKVKQLKKRRSNLESAHVCSHKEMVFKLAMRKTLMERNNVRVPPHFYKSLA